MASSQWPPGFRFRPTDQELVAFYLARKVSGRSIQAGIITEVDLYKCEPWDLPDKSSFQNDVEWYFFSPRDKKYPNGSRTNRATEAGYWKATGKDRVVRTGSRPVGMKKTLVFYRGRAPHGERTDWIMHEYRLDPVDSRQFQQDAFVLCRVFRKVNAGAKNEEETFPNYLDDELAVCSPLNKPEKDVQPQCVEPEEGQVCPPSPEEGQVCSPSPTEVQVPLLVEENGSPTVIEDDGLNDFLMGLFAADEQVRVVAKEEIQPPCEASKQFVDCEEAPGSGSSPGDGDDYGLGLEQIEQLDVGPDSTDGFNVMDILAGDFFELNDLETADFQTSYDGVALLGQDGESLPSEVTWMNDDIGISFEQSAYGTADEFFQQNLKPVDTTSLTTTEESKHPLKRFLNMLGSVHVLPASAAEFPANFSSSSKLILRGSNSDDRGSGGGGSGGGSGGGGGGIHVAAMKVCVTAVTVACRCKKEAAAKEEEVKREKEEEGGERRRILRKWNIDGRLVFVFMLGCISAVVWILLLPAISRVANYVDSLFF